MRRAVVVAFLLALTMVPVAQASGGVIDLVTISGNGEVGAGPIDVNLSILGVGGVNSASVNWSATLSDSEGNLIDSDSGNSLVDDGVTSYVETMLGDAPLGYSNLTITLTGDIGTPGANQWITYSEIIQRLRPLDISVGEPTITGVNSSGVETSNLTINDGDFARVDVPVINDGDITWNGSLNLTLDQLQVTPVTVDIDPDSSLIISFYTGQLAEGAHDLVAQLNGPSDADSSDDSVSLQFQVGPPPLPELVLSVQRLNEPEPGSSISWNLSATNIGESQFDGLLVCLFDSDEILSEGVSIPVSGTVYTNVTMISKPGQLHCGTEDARTSSTTNASDSVLMDSAIFIGAGHSTPTLLGGPWHAGDEVTLSILLRNEGNTIGNANMRIEIDGAVQNGTPTTLEDGKAGEVSQEFTFASAGSHVVNWSVNSPDGAVDSNLSGSITIPVLTAQTIIMDIESISIVEEGIELSWSIDLSEGRDRIVNLNFGVIKDGLKGDTITEERNLLSGITYGSMVIGYQDGQQSFASISVTDWTIGFGSYVEDTESIPDYTFNPQVTVNPITQPSTPSSGSQVTVSYTLSNTGEGTIPPGQIVITDSEGEILSSIATVGMEESSRDESALVNWPEGDSVKLIVSWHVAAITVSDEAIITSDSVESESDEFTIPWGGILGGLVLGMLLIFVIRIKFAPKKEKVEKKKVTKKEESKDEKVEVACPSCDRRLRVPSTYNGGVRCPECETRFDVEAEVEEPDETADDEVDDEIDESSKELWSASDNDILACPKCTRKLKVPFDRRPAKARCPACETIFEARSE
jgi:hypothetical protein